MGRMLAAAVCAAATISSGSACAMPPASATATSTPAAAAFARCTVAGAEKLPAELGGADGVCRAIGRAAGAAAGGAAVDLRVMSPHSLGATVTTGDGRKLAEQQVSTSDRQLHRGSLILLGTALAAQLGATR
ncbi:hypothetical protein [Sphingomonas sp.]|uniref:hypothetical protein n=1 Tax=Sphingomonas sp. TaxID=28214 RepID=UPI00286E0D32|nr:hypothetical protein [Sphingomonas sp.]